MPKKTPKKAISNYSGIYGNRTGITNSIYSELLGTRSAEFGWNINPHVHPGLFQIFFIEQGTFKFFQAERRSQLTAPCLLLIPPTAMHGFEFNEAVSGRILSISESYFVALNDQMTTSFTAGDILVITKFVDPYTSQVILDSIKTIDWEISGKQPEKAVMLSASLQRLMIMIHRLTADNDASAVENGNPASGHFLSFMKLLRQNGNKNTVSELATKLHITPIHLNRICKSMSGKTAGQLQNDYLVTEAKKYLTYTGHSVSQIAYLLNFEYPNYFARFFKKHTGQSPKIFRAKS